MAAPTAPTLVSITTEAVKKAGFSNPNSVLLTRAQDEWMAEIDSDIWTKAKKLKSLQTTGILTTTNGLNRYALPSDYSSDLDMALLHGSISGTAQGGAVGSITLEATSTLDSAFLIGREIVIISGTGLNSMSQITAYDSATKIATVTPDFATAPANGDTYMLVSLSQVLKQTDLSVLDRESFSAVKGRPMTFSPMGDSDTGEFILYPTPYNITAVYVLRLRYYANLMNLDLAGTLKATLYSRWRGVYTAGVYYLALLGRDDSRADQAFKVYQFKLTELMSRETYGMDLNNLQMVVRDY